jgi:hypothetical protein
MCFMHTRESESRDTEVVDFRTKTLSLQSRLEAYVKTLRARDKRRQLCLSAVRPCVSCNRAKVRREGYYQRSLSLGPEGLQSHI